MRLSRLSSSMVMRLLSVLRPTVIFFSSFICLCFVLTVLVFFFFFSSRRRHTRCLSDWSSDVCSSDLPAQKHLLENHLKPGASVVDIGCAAGRFCFAVHGGGHDVVGVDLAEPMVRERSEERRVGKECRSRGSRYH